MRTRPLFLPFALAAASLFGAYDAFAGRTVSVDGLSVEVDVQAGVVRTKKADGGAREIPIAIDRSRLDPASVVVEALPVGESRQVVHVKVRDAQRKDLAFEAILAPQAAEPIFAGLTGYTAGEDGDRSGQVVLVYDRDDATKFVIVAETREDTRICGQAQTPLSARGLEPKSMQLRGATLHRIDKKARDEAKPVVAKAIAASAPLARLLVATGGSAAGAGALTDGNPSTTWIEQRPGDGHGEFATLRAPSEVPVHALVVTVAPKTPLPTGAAPRTFFVATDSQLFHVTMPEDAWSRPGVSYEVPLPEPVRTTCVAVVLDEAYARGQAAPQVGISEIAALTKFDIDKASLDDVAKALSTDRADEAVAVLRRSGEPGLGAVTRTWETLDSRGRALAIDVVASVGTCDDTSVDLLTRGLADKEAEVRKRALGRLERCGKSAAASLATILGTADEARRAAIAPVLATVGPSAAIEPLTDQLGKGSPETRHAIRSGLARAISSAPREKLVTILQRKDGPVMARLDGLRAIGARLPELRPESSAAVADILLGSPDMPTRWLVAQPLANLARSNDATSGELTRLSEMARRDPDPAVRARAVELASGIGPLVPAVLEATHDPAPRVREAAIKVVAAGHIAAGVVSMAQVLAKDPWTFNRAGAAEALGVLPQETTAQSALADALEDKSSRVRMTVLDALGKQHASRYASQVRDRLEDAKEDPDVRANAARALGTMCAQKDVDRLTKLAQRARSPADDSDDRIGMAAIEALGSLHPSDIDQRLAPLRAKDVRIPVRRAAERALADQGSCR